jgi:dihydroneopterin aldolase
VSDEPELPDDDDADVDDYDDEGPHTEIVIEISGLSLYTHHGVTKAEQEIGQRLVVDLRLEVGEVDATVTDQIDDTVDYSEVCSTVALVAQSRSFKTLERLCAAIADRLIADFDAERVMVRCAKPEPPIPLPVEEVSVELWRDVGED